MSFWVKKQFSNTQKQRLTGIKSHISRGVFPWTYDQRVLGRTSTESLNGNERIDYSLIAQNGHNVY